LRKLPGWIKQRQANATRLQGLLAGLPGIVVDAVKGCLAPSWYKFYVRVDAANLPAGMRRGDLLAGLMRLGIQCGSGACPDMSREAAFSMCEPRRDGDLERARELGSTTIMLPVDHLLDDTDMDNIAAAFREVLS